MRLYSGLKLISLSLNLEKTELIPLVFTGTEKVRIVGLLLVLFWSNYFTEQAFSTVFNNSNIRSQTAELR